jgi:hypothetical protein
VELFYLALVLVEKVANLVKKTGESFVLLGSGP